MTAKSDRHGDSILVGIDGGGTHCRAGIYDKNGLLLGTGHGGPANPVNGLEQTKESIVNAVKEARYEAGLECSLAQFVLGAGLAGLHLPVMQAKINDWQHPFGALHTTTDLHAAVSGAHLGQDGAVIIIGTGFSALGIVKGRQISIGGYGFPINANCSGSWFGLELVKAVLLDHDGVGPATSMTQDVLTNENAISLATRTNNAAPSIFGRFSPVVFQHAEQGDDVARQLVKEGAAFIDRVIEKLLENQVPRVSLLGGVAPHIVDWLDPEYKRYLCVPREAPEFGAMMYAREKQTLLLGEEC